MRLHVSTHGELDVAEACRLWEASPATVRRDFVEIERTGFARREWGRLRTSAGVTAGAERERAMVPFGEREVLQAEEKRRIAQAAAALIADGHVVIVDGGTTTLQLVPFLAPRPIKIVTNSIAIAHAIDRGRAGRSGAEVFLTGGQLYPDSYLLVGPQAKDSLRAYRANWVFLSAAGATVEGVFNSNQLVVETEQVMVEQAERVALLADASKFGRTGMVPLCGWERLSVVVTDRKPERAVMKALTKHHVKLTVAGGD